MIYGSKTCSSGLDLSIAPAPESFGHENERYGPVP